MGRTARGVTGMRFKLEGDEVVSLEVISEPTFDEAESDFDSDDADVAENIDIEEDAAGDDASGVGPEVIVVTDGGIGKRSFVSTYRKTNRGARGVVNIRLREGENVLAVVQITGEDELLLTTERGQMTRIPVSEIRRVGRASQGVKIMNLKQGDKITGVAKLIKVDEAEENAPAVSSANSVMEETPIEAGEIVIEPDVPSDNGSDIEPEA
jgi:DNA gyrase subunit A